MKHSLCILLVEDDPALGPITLLALVQISHRATLTTTAAGAYKHLSEPHQFELVLLDLQLHDELSEPLILRLKHEGLEMPRIVIYSAQPVPELQRVARVIGASGHVQKPASIEEIQQVIDRIAA